MTSGAFPPRLRRSNPAPVAPSDRWRPWFRHLEFNIATQKGRPTGSSFKPFVLASAFEKGFVPADQINGIGTCEFDNPGGFPNPYEANNFSGPKAVRLQRFAHRPSHRRTVRIFDSA